MNSDYRSLFCAKRNGELEEKPIPQQPEDAKQAFIAWQTAQFLKIYKEKVPLNLQLREGKLIKKLNAFKDLGLPLENYTDKILNNEKILKNLKHISEQKVNNEKILTEMTTDILLFASLIPLFQRSGLNKRIFFRYTIEPLCPALIQQIFKEFRRQKSLDVSNHFRLSHINLRDYKKKSVFQKMHLLSLSHLSLYERKEIMRGDLFQRIHGQENLKDWLLAFSGNLEQDYLNTCYSASYNQELLAHLPTLAEGLWMSDKVIESIRQSLLLNKKEADYVLYVKPRMNSEKKKMRKIKKKILLESPLSFENIRRLILAWHRSFQRICLLIDKNLLGYPTKKIISGHWQTSVILIAPLILTKRFANIGDNPPYLHMRREGVSEKKLHILLDHRLFSAKNRLNPKNYDKILNGSKEATEEERNRAIDYLWSNLFAYGGAIAANDQHALYLRAARMERKNVFLVGDPIESRYKVIKKDAIKNFFSKNRLFLES